MKGFEFLKKNEKKWCRIAILLMKSYNSSEEMENENLFYSTEKVIYPSQILFASSTKAYRMRTPMNRRAKRQIKCTPMDE
jgi:hypothetical protein